MIRPFLAVAAGLLCGILGIRQARCIREENATLSRWEALLRHLCLLLREGLSLPDAFEQAGTELSAADLLLRRLAAQLRAQPLASLPQLYTPQGKEGAFLSRLLEGLSHGSQESRILCAQQAEKEAALLAQSAREKAQQDAHMWATLGWACGACLTLLLL